MDDNYLPKITAAMYVLVAEDAFGDWYLVWPTLIDVGDKTDTVSATAATIGGRLMEEWVDTW